MPTDSVEIEVSSSGPMGLYNLVYTGAAAPSFRLETFTMQTGAIVTGAITENATIVLPDLPVFTILRHVERGAEAGEG